MIISSNLLLFIVSLYILYYNRLSDGFVINGRQISEIMDICTRRKRQRCPLNKKFAFLCYVVLMFCTSIIGTKSEQFVIVVQLLLVLFWNQFCLRCRHQFCLSRQSNQAGGFIPLPY